ncbi:MAG: PAS domain S-box protein [Proteobacteria bacterium]|nr:PAS domain S-box protein [Pseudomonadota bacterium]MBU1452787.1 PAS domain S-box protein [Pseudomonadota bacterium]MBU2469100.1 PAS domain S-box protein [Pseudomonadota bacterium]MBU2519433.1 PAS domain S-box protein [Pseudomonadota bacterium]
MGNSPPEKPNDSKELTQLRAQVRLLSRAKDRQRELYLRTPAMLHSCGFQGRVVNVSDRWLEVMGYQRHEVLGRLETEFFTGESRRQYLQEHQPRFRQEGSLNDVPLAMVRKDGTVIQVLFSAVAEQDPQGEPGGWLAVLRDITRQVDAERALEDTRERLKGIFQNSSVPMGMCDLEGHWLEVNPAFRELLGYSQQQLLELDYLQVTHPEDREYSAQQVDRLIKGEIAGLRMNNRYLNRQGEPVWVDMYINPVRGSDGRVQYLVGAGVDITERKRTREALAASEAQMRAILDGITSNIAFVNPDMEILWANRAAAQSVGLTPEQMRGRTCHSLWADPGQPCQGCPTVEAMKEGRSVHQEMRTPDGRVWDEKGEPVFDEDGRLVGVVEIAHDITEQKRAEEARAASEARFRELVENIREVFWVRDPHTGQLEYVSPAAEEIFSHTREYLYANPLGILEIVLPADRPVVERAMADQRMRGADTDVEYRIQRKDGAVRWIWSRTVCVRGPEGRVERVLGVAEDVTERKQAQLALAKSQEKFAMVFKNSPLWMTITTLEDGVFLDVNDAFTEITGFTRGEVLGRTAKEVGLWSDAYRRNEVVRQIKEQGLLRDFEVEYILKSGERRHALWSAEPLVLDDRPCLISVLRDVTRRKMAEAALRQSNAALELAQKTALLGHWNFDPETRQIQWSEELFQIMGLDPAKGVPPYEEHRRLIRSGDWERFDQAVQRAVETGEAFDLEVGALWPDGSLRHIHMRGLARQDQRGKPRQLFGIVQDITGRKQAEQARRDLEKQLRQAQKLEAVGTLSAGIAHDFNNILAAILGYGELSLDQLDPGHPCQENLERMIQSTLRAKNLVKQMLAFSRAAKSRPAPARLAPLVEEALRLLEPERPPGISLHCRLDQELVASVDSHQIEQVAVNLGRNALQAMAQGPGSLTVELERVAVDPDQEGFPPGLAAGPHARLRVADTGAGIDSQVRERVFDPFYTTREVGQGVGMGLAVVHGIVTSHRGLVELASRPGQGTVFTVYLPLEQEPEPESESEPIFG